MARILVLPDEGEQAVLDEKAVRPLHLDDEHSTAQIMQRLQWAVDDAERVRSNGHGSQNGSKRTAQGT